MDGKMKSDSLPCAGDVVVESMFFLQSPFSTRFYFHESTGEYCSAPPVVEGFRNSISHMDPASASSLRKLKEVIKDDAKLNTAKHFSKKHLACRRVSFDIGNGTPISAQSTSTFEATKRKPLWQATRNEILSALPSDDVYSLQMVYGWDTNFKAAKIDVYPGVPNICMVNPDSIDKFLVSWIALLLVRIIQFYFLLRGDFFCYFTFNTVARERLINLILFLQFLLSIV